MTMKYNTLVIVLSILVLALSGYIAFREGFDLGASLRETTKGPLPCVPSSTDKPATSRFMIENYGLKGPLHWDYLREGTKQEFLMEGKMQVIVEFLDETTSSGNVDWPNSVIDSLVQAVKDGTWDSVHVSSYGPNVTKHFMDTFEKYPMKGKDVLVVGSRWPWVEALCLVYGAKSITTVDFIVPVLHRDDLRAITIEELDATNEVYDVVISYSSLEHDGLGRYGDPLHPTGDLERMKKLRELVKDDGLFILGIPIGQDALVFNLHRIYGPIRFSLISKGWTVLESVGCSLEEGFKYPIGVSSFCQPVIVLKKSS